MIGAMVSSKPTPLRRLFPKHATPSAKPRGRSSEYDYTMTNEYMEELMRRIDNKMQAYELYRRPQDKMMLECMVADYEAKMKLKLQDEQ